MSGINDDLWIDTALAVQRGEPNSDVFVRYVEAMAASLTDALVNATRGTLPSEVRALRDEMERHVAVLRRVHPKPDTIEHETAKGGDSP